MRLLLHVLPIYIDLARADNEYGTNLWDYIIEEILRETSTEARVWGARPAIVS